MPEYQDRDEHHDGFGRYEHDAEDLMNRPLTDDIREVVRASGRGEQAVVEADFDREFSRAFTEQGWRTGISPREAADRWQRFAADCAAGFPWDLDDYLNDLSLRTVLSEVLPQLSGPEAAGLREAIERTDRAVRQVLAEETFPSYPVDQWWLRNSPSYAARGFCVEFESAYGVRIRPQSRFDDDVAELSRLVAAGLSPADACLRFRSSGRYAADVDGLCLRAAREALDLDRKAARILWSWLTGKITDAEFQTSLGQV